MRLRFHGVRARPPVLYEFGKPLDAAPSALPPAYDPRHVVPVGFGQHLGVTAIQAESICARSARQSRSLKSVLAERDARSIVLGTAGGRRDIFLPIGRRQRARQLGSGR
jgi:hypothetical protein